MYKKLLNQTNINILTFLISIIFSIQIYLFKEIKNNDIKINKLHNTTIQLSEQYKNIKEKIKKLDTIQKEIQKINITLVKILENNNYLLEKVRYCSEYI